MDYQESLDWLYSTQLFGIKLGLENVRELCLQLDAFPTTARILHVAGTNGKGSVCAMAESIARASGCRTGLFTSPHLIRFNERIRIDGIDLADDDVASGLTEIREKVAHWETHPTFFEIATILALLSFKKHACDLILLETGLGGRLDATNIITPDVSILTQIDVDHAQWLGETIEKIAWEKAGIIKTGKPVITFRQSETALGVFRKMATAQSAELTILEQPYLQFTSSLPGSHQTWNAALAVEGLQKAGLRLKPEWIEKGLRKVAWPGRFQEIRPGIFLDGAHNPAAARMLVHTWRDHGLREDPVILIGMLADKDIPQTLAALAPLAASWIATAPNSQRSLPPDRLAEEIRKMNSRPVRIAPSAVDIFASPPKYLLICGSLFLVGEALAFFQKTPAARSSEQ